MTKFACLFIVFMKSIILHVMFTYQGSKVKMSIHYTVMLTCNSGSPLRDWPGRYINVWPYGELPVVLLHHSHVELCGEFIPLSGFLISSRYNISFKSNKTFFFNPYTCIEHHPDCISVPTAVRTIMAMTLFDSKHEQHMFFILAVITFRCTYMYDS